MELAVITDHLLLAAVVVSNKMALRILAAVRVAVLLVLVGEAVVAVVLE